MLQSAALTRETIVTSHAFVINHCDARHLRIDAIESTFSIHKFDALKQNWAKETKTAFNVIIQDLDHCRSLVRYISDVMDFDHRIRAYDRQCTIPPPKFVESQHLADDDAYQAPSSQSTFKQRCHRQRQGLSLLMKKTIAGLRRKKSNSERFEIYLRRCVLDPIIGRSSLLGDFLFTQRTEDKIMPFHAISKSISLDQQQQQKQHAVVVPDLVSSIGESPINSICSVSASPTHPLATSPCSSETDNTSISTPSPALLHKSKRRDHSLCELPLSAPPLPMSSCPDETGDTSVSMPPPVHLLRKTKLQDHSSCELSSPASSLTTPSCPDETENASLSTPPPVRLLHNKKRRDHSSGTLPLSGPPMTPSSCPEDTDSTSVSLSSPALLLDKKKRRDGSRCELPSPFPSPSSDALAEEEEPVDPLITIYEEDEEEMSIHDFDLIKVLGAGCSGKVLLARRQADHANNCSKLLALKAIPKLQGEIAHAKAECQILSALSQRKHPFLVQLQYTFQDPTFLYLAFDFYACGDLATQLKLHMRFPPDRCRLYAAEMLLGIQELHQCGVIYRDFKPENILIGADGHLVLTDFGLSKRMDVRNSSSSSTTTTTTRSRTDTICGTPEYLAPEQIYKLPYSYEIDYWSYGTILYEMIDGVPPFWDQDPSVMKMRTLVAPLEFDNDRFDLATRDLLTGLLQRNPDKRLGRDMAAIRAHSYFATLDWALVYEKRYEPQYVPHLEHPEDLSHFDDQFLNMPVDCALEKSIDEVAGQYGI